jgi:hypothetical protein
MMTNPVKELTSSTNKEDDSQMELAPGWEVGRVLDALIGKKRLDLAQFLRDRYDKRFFEPIALLEREAVRGISWARGNPEPGETIRPYGFAIMSLACQMVETLESYIRGIPTTNECDFDWMAAKDCRCKRSPKHLDCQKADIPGTDEAFKSFFSRYATVFPGLKGDEFVRNVRNALLHQSQTRNGWKINIHQYDEAAENTSEVYKENEKILFRDSFVSQLRCCFTNFIEHLRQHSDKDDVWQKPERKIWWIAWLSDPEFVMKWLEANPAHARVDKATRRAVERNGLSRS